MVSPLASKRPVTPQEIDEFRAIRDRQIALRYQDLGGGRKVARLIAGETGINIRTVYRAVRKFKHEKAPGSDNHRGQEHSDSKNPHATSGQVTESATPSATAEP